MVRIIYGVSGEGSGHSSRSRAMARHLIKAGHEVRIASYDRGYENLRDEFQVLEIEGLCIATDDNRVNVVKTFTENLKRLPKGHRTLQDLRKLFKEFKPDVVITDFEPMTAYLANHYDLPLITIDNQHRMRYMDYECPSRLRTESQITKTIIRAMVPRPDVSLAICFHRGEATNDRTFFFSPILRKEVLERSPSSGEHVLVYVTRGFESLLDELVGFPREQFLVYGYDRTEQQDNLRFCPFSKVQFLDDLASAKAVIATAGFTLISEALYLRKPYLALPMQGQFEQELNGFQLQQLGYGRSVERLEEDAIGGFLYRLPEYRERLSQYDPGDQADITRKLDELLTDDASEAKRYHAARS